MRDGCAENFRDGLAHVREGGARAEIRAGIAARAVGEDRDVFARMIRGGIYGIGIATVVRGDDQQIGRMQGGGERTEERIEFLERAREAFDVLAMAVEHVKIHEVGEDQTARLLREGLSQLGHSVGVVSRGDVIFHAAAVIDVVNLADAEHGNFFLGQDIQQHRAWRLDRVIVTAFGAAKISRRAGR